MKQEPPLSFNWACAQCRCQMWSD